jgi:putative ABC transport system permease protein
MMIFILAWKNIWRNKKRSLIILAATAVGLAAGLLSVGAMTGMYDSMVDAGIRRELGHIQIHTAAYNKDQLINQYLPNVDSVIQTVRSVNDIESYTTHSIVEGMASSASVATGVKVIAIDPVQEKTVFLISESMIEGSYLSSDSAEFQRSQSIVIGKKLSEKLKLRLRSRIVLSFAGLDGNIIYGAFCISGIYKTDATNFDGMNVFIKQKDLSSLVGSFLPIHEIVVRTRNQLLLDTTKNAIQKSLPNDVIVESWKDISPELKLTADLTDVSNIIFLGLILFALLFGLTNTLLMSVLDRVRDFGVLLAIGLYRRRLFFMIILESLMLSFTGGAIGVPIGWVITQYFHTKGIDLSTFSAGLESYGIPSMLYPYIKPSIYPILTIMMVITSIIAALYPAIKAIRLKPVQAIRTIA